MRFVSKEEIFVFLLSLTISNEVFYLIAWIEADINKAY
jgi:hypothetical protein